MICALFVWSGRGADKSAIWRGEPVRYAARALCRNTLMSLAEIPALGPFIL